MEIGESVPHGVVKTFTFEGSAIFPGTTRNVSVFIPAQYDGKTPACVYVQQDGYHEKIKDLAAGLIAAGEMPVTICVFVSPGNVPPRVEGGFGRRNRSYEYDGVRDDYVRFLLDELLPYVSRTFDLRLSSEGKDRCIGGASSGGIAAFNAAWQRPDAFSRVYVCSGSFVAFNGGNEFPTMVRKFEAKPIRAYLTAGTGDMTNAAGDWLLVNQEMDKALQFSGYDCEFHLLEGGHNVDFAEQFPDAMRFLWKGWPAPVTPGPSAPRVRDMIVEGKTWQLCSEGYEDARALAANSKGEVFFVDAAANKVFRVGLDGKTAVFLEDAAHANGLTFGRDDELYTVSTQTGNVLAYDAEGKRRTIASGLPGKSVTAMPDGGLYVTAEDSGEVWHLKDGQRAKVDSGLKRATGLAYRPDQWLLSVADGDSKWVYSYEIAPDGSLMNREPLFSLQVSNWEDDAGAEAVCYATEGQMLVGTRAGVQACADDGPTQVILPLPDGGRVTGLALGGDGMNTLFATSGGKVWKRTVKIHGVGPWSSAIPVKSSPL